VTCYEGAQVKKIIISTGVVTTVAGQYLSHGNVDGDSTVSLLNRPYGIVIDPRSTSSTPIVYISDMSQDAIKKLDLSTGKLINQY
jgi:hypothetical protein